MGNKFTMQLEAKLINESFIRSSISNFILPLNPTVAEINDIKTAVSEAFTNAIVHGYNNNGGTVFVECCYAENIVTIKIKDYGVGIENIKKAREPFFTTKADQERSGMGFTLMETFMDDLVVTNNTEGGICVCMTKQICG